MTKEKVSLDKVKHLQHQEVEKNEIVDGIDAIDRGAGRILSKLGEIIVKGF